MCHYKHFTLIEREKILLFYAEGKSVTAIAELLGRSKSTISRELRRNTSDDEYIPAIFPSRISHDSEAPMKTPMVFCASIFLRAKTLPTTLKSI